MIEGHQESPRRKITVRKKVGWLIIVALLGGMAWLLLFSGMAEPITLAISDLYAQAATLINNPLGIDWGDKLIGAIAVILPMILLLLFLFDQKLR